MDEPLNAANVRKAKTCSDSGWAGSMSRTSASTVCPLPLAPNSRTAFVRSPRDASASRAVRTACEIHSAMQGLSAEVGRKLQAHIGIASGQVLASGTGSDAHREYTVTGSSVNLASRLQDRAAAGQTWDSSSRCSGGSIPR